MELIIKFTDSSNSFAQGVEFGRLLYKMETGESPIENEKFPVRIENRQVLIDSCAYYGYFPLFSGCPIGGWVNFIAIKNGKGNT